MRTTGARWPENATKHNAVAPKNTISRKDVERHAWLTEATITSTSRENIPQRKPQVSRRSLIQARLRARHRRYDLSYKDSRRRSIKMRVGAATIVMKSRTDKRVRMLPPPPLFFCVSVHFTKFILEMFANAGRGAKG